MIAILGAGFGLYGYLPALIDANETVVLPQRYREPLRQRPELAPYEASITWSSSEEEALNMANGVIVARRPQDQVDLLPGCLEREGIRRLVLEKPLAPTPDASIAILSTLLGAQRQIRIGYVFRYTAWGDELRHQLGMIRNGTLAIQWNLLAHHFRHNLDNWKRFDAQGGGALRFYGIQLIALLAELGYRDVIESTSSGAVAGQTDRWAAMFAGADLPNCDVVVNSRSERTEFRIEGKATDGQNRLAVLQADPFSAQADGSPQDRRVGPLKRLWLSFDEDETSCPDWYAAANALWRSTERCDKHQGPSAS